jgi:hypothetical protein
MTTDATAGPTWNPGDGLILGRAVVFGTRGNPDFTAGLSGRDDAKPRCRVRWRRGCFDDWLARVRAGRSEVRMCLAHDTPRPLCSTRDGSLHVWRDGRELLFAVAPVSESGRAAIRTARDFRTWRLASIGARVDRYELDGDPADPRAVLTVTRGRLDEISLTARAAFPRTRVCVY